MEINVFIIFPFKIGESKQVNTIKFSRFHINQQKLILACSEHGADGSVMKNAGRGPSGPEIDPN